MQQAREIAILTVMLCSFALTTRAQGSDLYTSKCQMCHGATGLADTPAGKALKARPLNSADVIKESDAELLAVIKNGKGKMPAFTGKLSDSEMTTLVAHIRKLQR